MTANEDGASSGGDGNVLDIVVWLQNVLSILKPH